MNTTDSSSPFITKMATITITRRMDPTGKTCACTATRMSTAGACWATIWQAIRTNEAVGLTSPLRSQHDYQVNLKAELEIRHLHEKIDPLLSHQWERLVQIQELQLELLSELGRRG